MSSSASLGGTGVTSDIKQHEYACGVGAISHGQGTSCGIADDTVQPVFVMVRHKGTRTQNFICGLQFAKVIVREIGLWHRGRAQHSNYKISCVNEASPLVSKADTTRTTSAAATASFGFVAREDAV